MDVERRDRPVVSGLRGARANFGGDDRGASSLEYGLLIAGIASLIVTVVFAFNGSITGLFSDTCESISATAGTTTC